jgi:hypothetical protein
MQVNSTVKWPKDPRGDNGNWTVMEIGQEDVPMLAMAAFMRDREPIAVAIIRNNRIGSRTEKVLVAELEEVVFATVPGFENYPIDEIHPMD